MALLARERIRPYYGQVEFRDPGKLDYPDWGDGESDVVATASCVAVATRSDHLGQVEVEVWMGLPDAVAVMGQPKWTGLMHVTGGHAVFGNTVGNHLVPVSLTAGDYHVWVFTLPLGSPADTVMFSLEPVGTRRG